ncbi:MAG: hypothetical protein VW711_12635 [Verrucomicrobiales bacterium]
MAGSALAGTQILSSLATTSLEPVRKVAGILTWYKQGSHADVLIGKILEGWRYDGGVGPRLELASLYVDQFPEDDMARALSEKHGFPIFNSIEDALSLQSGSLAVDGVLSIGEHGDYPTNSKGQKLYPRRRFFERITRAFRQFGRVVPVFSDKHLGPVWEDAKWMYDQAQALNIPFMAGSSLPVSFRQPDWAPPMGSSMMAAVGVGYSGLDIYGTHTLEVYQAMVERRLGGETGVRSVQWFGAAEMWQKVEDGTVDAKVLQAALDATPKAGGTPGSVRDLEGDGVGLFLFEYVDGFQGAVFMLPGYLAGCGFAARMGGDASIHSVGIEERREPHYPHFAYLLKAIETMVWTGRPSYPVERTLLTSGVLDRVLTSRHQGGRKLLTPELQIAYQPVEYPHAPMPLLEEGYGRSAQ